MRALPPLVTTVRDVYCWRVKSSLAQYLDECSHAILNENNGMGTIIVRVAM